MLFRPADSSKEIVNFYRRYLISTFSTNRDYYNKQLIDQLMKDEAIANGPYISMSDSYAKGESIRELVDEGIFCGSMLKLGKMHPDRKLYKHQVEASKKAVDGNNLIITTGTGSGKTECFLLPVINQLLQEKEAGTLGPGVRTLIIYPMNALVNDQIRRLREIFEDYEDEDITFGKYTGETKEEFNDAYSLFLEREGAEPKCNELISRKQMRETPPNILITNYAMLEYLLLRPGDNIFFNEQNAKKWRFIVLDEAHTYGGATGIEVGSLLKRVKGMLKRNDIQFLLTSATLGSENDNKQILDFAEALCSSRFDENSIIRSKTAPPIRPEIVERLNFEIYKDLATKIRENYPFSEILKTLEAYRVNVLPGETEEESVERSLYSMINGDAFYYDVRHHLINQTKQLGQLSKDIGVSVNDIADFIAVASNAQWEGDKIFEARYHMFLRGIEGVFITLAPSNKLFTKKMEWYREDPFDEGTEYKAFEISFCHNCKSIFIVGQERDSHLIQLSRFDDEYEPEVFLLEGEYDMDGEEESNDNQYLLCSKCGAIGRASSISGLKCEHDSVNYNKVTKIKSKGERLNTCPCCHTVNTGRSILRPYFLGNEAATAVIATALYDVLPDTKVTKKIILSNDEFFGSGQNEIVETTEEQIVKQFLAFSDNRQAAAFFASYLQNTYQDNLIKRIMTQIAHDYEDALKAGMKLATFVTKVEEMMGDRNVAPKEDRHKIAWISVAKEIINYKAHNSMENEGTLFFDIDISLPENSKLGFNAIDTTNLFKVMLRQFMKHGAFTLPVSLTEADFEELSFGKQITGYNKTSSSNSYIKSWLPKAGRKNAQSKMAEKLLPDKGEAFFESLLGSIWDYSIKDTTGVVRHDSNLGKYVLNLDKVLVKRPEKLYRCKECKSVTPYNINNVCLRNKCNGQLEEYAPEIEKKEDHYRVLYETLNMDPLIAKEHTAQLGSNKAYEYQNSFKSEEINVLSCSTTFEMGVDVGTLETVFMRNMPPTPANYAQRAGRAGRSVKSAAYALTYCPNNSHDLNFFKDPVSMIRGTINPPAFKVNNEKIVLRHIFASAFSFFWRARPDLYKRYIGKFVDEGGIDEFKKYLDSRPENLREYLMDTVAPELQSYYQIESFGWTNRLFSSDVENPGVFDIAEKKYRADLQQLELAKQRYVDEQNAAPSGSKEFDNASRNAWRVSKSISTIRDQKLVSYLSQNNLIPKYGFPVDTVELKSLGHSSFLDQLRLDRDLFSAISEYAPDSQVVADGKLITSRYVRKLGEYEWPKYNYAFCKNCHTLNKTLFTEDLPENCKQCGQPLDKHRHRQYIIPRFGFIVDNKDPEPVGTSKPERTYKGEISYIGDGEKIESMTFSLCGKTVELGTSKLDELAVLNTSSFYICEECGYGELHPDSFDLSKPTKHKKSDGYYCTCESLTPFALGHEFQTDVVQIKFPSENITEIEKAYTILFALLEGLSKCLHIDRNELSGCLHWYRNDEYNTGNFDFILFDNTPGGAGYVRNLRKSDTIIGMMQEGFRIVSECTCGGDSADTACYSCLCNYYNQKQHGYLQRKYAIEFFESMKNGKTMWECNVIAE